jgi:energy-coupling factor transporter ATP-binding protein EcfA2
MGELLMVILHEILKWSKGLPEWQQDAIARLYAKPDLSVQDFDDVYALLKAAHGIIDTKGRVTTKLADVQVAAPIVADRFVQLAAIKNLRNVNALAAGQRLPINPSGLSVIYGENGSGKSGYSRVLKKACRARDQRELIHPNAHIEPSKVGIAQASFEIIVDGAPLEVEWTSGKEPPEQLSSIAIFDSHCARAYVDNQGDFAYVPYGLDILEGLVNVCTKLRDMATKEQTDNKPNVELFAALGKTQTLVGKLLTSLSAKTKPQDVEALATLTKADQERLVTLNKTLAETDPKQKAQIFKLRATRFASLATRIGTVIDRVNDTCVANLKSLIEKAKDAKQAAILAGQKFKETPGLLPGTGGEAWKALFDAARAFALESHPGKTFPYLGPKSACPLCQKPLDLDGDARLKAFEDFYQQAAEKAEKIARKLAVDAYRAIEQVQLDLLIDEALTKELEGVNQKLADDCTGLQKALLDRRSAILEASKPENDFNAIPALPQDSREALETASTKLLAEAKVLEDSMDEKAKAALVSEKAELDARLRLSDLKGAVLDSVAKFMLIEKLKACFDAAATTAISRKSTELSKTMATQEVADALNNELKKLNAHELKVMMKPESPGGKTRFKLVLEVQGNTAAKDILSEGEQRAIAIASFLTEVNLGKRRGGIVFDDPVSSLDHRRRWHVARRLAEEAQQRQVIVLTHDIYFLCILQQEADTAGIDISLQCIRKTPTGFGMQTDRLPFDAMSTIKRVKSLRQMHEATAKAHNAGDDDEAKRLTRDTYYNLRLAWERGVEEVLFQGAVTRFAEGISTQKLSYVVVEDHDYAVIDAGMTRSSKFAHDPALGAHLPTPHPDELLVDIESLETWRKSVETRKDAIRARRS